MIRVLRNYSGELKLRIVIESFQKNKVAAVARHYGIHPNLLRRWRRELKTRGKIIFAPEGRTEARRFEKRIACLEAVIDRKSAEIDVLRNFLNHFVRSRSLLAEHARATVARGEIGINAVCRLLGISKKTFYACRGRPDLLKLRHETLRQMILEVVEMHPSFGYRRIKAVLEERYATRVNHKLLKKLLSTLSREVPR